MCLLTDNAVKLQTYTGEKPRWSMILDLTDKDTDAQMTFNQQLLITLPLYIFDAFNQRDLHFQPCVDTTENCTSHES